MDMYGNKLKQSLAYIIVSVGVGLLMSCGGSGVPHEKSSNDILDTIETSEEDFSESQVEPVALHDSVSTKKNIQVPTKRALVIGIGEQEDPSWAKINGDKDVPYVIEMLSNAGYTDIRTLVNRKATKVNVVNVFRSLAGRCGEGDVVYIHFSGHGQQVTDVSGDEEDGLDESWIPYDAYLKYGEKDRGEKHLVDDEINVLLNAIRRKVGVAGKILVVVDACHSATSTRGRGDDVAMRGVRDTFEIPKTSKEKTTKTSGQWLTLSACKDYQTNQEMKSPKVGKLTYALYSVAQEGEVTEKTVRSFVMKHRGSRLQTPVLTRENENLRLQDFF